MNAQERKEREARIEKQQEEYSAALIVCLTILTLALAILVIREWIDLKNEK